MTVSSQQRGTDVNGCRHAAVPGHDAVQQSRLFPNVGLDSNKSWLEKKKKNVSPKNKACMLVLTLVVLAGFPL